MKVSAKLQSLWRPLVVLALLTLPLLFTFCFRVVSSYSYDNDFGRDLVDIFAITEGDLTLLGPKLSFGGLHTGPYYYYLFAPILFLFPGQPEALLYANAVLAWLALALVGTVWYKLEKWSLKYVLVAVYWLGLSSYFLYSARGPGNAFSYVGWLVLLIGIYPQIWKRSQLWLWGLYGLGWGIVVNFHLAVLFLALPLLAILASSQMLKNWKLNWKKWPYKLALIGGFFASFAPLVLFELTHNFVMIQNTFVNQSYKAFTENTNLPNSLPTSTNPLANFWLFTAQAGDWLGVSLTAIVILLVILLFLRRKTMSLPIRTLVLSLLTALILAAVVVRSQLAFHYFFPFIILAQVTTIWVLAKEKIGFWLLAYAVLVNLWYLPPSAYQPSGRPIAVFRSVVDQVVAGEPLSSYSIAGELLQPFAVYVTRETPLAPIGFEYRYFLLTHGLASLPPSAYNQAERLIWFAELPLTDPAGVTSWELDQFGPRVLLHQRTIGSRTVYLFVRP